MFRDFLGFILVAGTSLRQVNHYILLASMQYLIDSNFTHSNIANYLTGVRVYFVVYRCDTTPFRHGQLQYFQKYMKWQRVFKPKASTVLTVDQLLQIVLTICNLSDSLPHPFKALYLVVFFSFLRIANSFQVTLWIKQSKTMQNRQDTTTISLLSLGSSPLCPVSAFTTNSQLSRSE